ncbi:MAG: TetR/AcrR family transcriptional regulator [Actinobacteria bacterium ATB1]|nr:TetR/AcrR family transcriptional regulator [Actinobacteria bacterium ATB1]
MEVAKMVAAGREPAGTAALVLDVAERHIQTRGYNGFSYADVAAELSVTKASLHYHFPSKSDLGEALLERHATRFAASLAEIDDSGVDAMEKVLAFTGLYGAVLRSGGMCLCGMLAAEFRTLPGGMQDGVARFFDLNEEWLTRVLEAGRADGTLDFEGRARDRARSAVAGLEGAMLMAGFFDDLSRFDSVVESLVEGLRA